MKNKIYIGIDTGTHTGLAVWKSPDKKFDFFGTMPIHKAMKIVLTWHETHGQDLFVRFEDARQRKWFGHADREKLQGAGSIKRDCTIWEDFLKDSGIEYEAVAPRKNITKLSAQRFKLITGFKGQTSEHARDAAMLVYGYEQKFRL